MSHAPFPTQLSIGMLAYVLHDPSDPNRVRSTPGGAVIGRLHPGTVMRIQEGPHVAGNHIWWKVHSPIANLSGWTAEGEPGQYYLAPVQSLANCPGLLPSRLQIRDRAQVNAAPGGLDDPNVVRAAPSQSAAQVALIHSGEEVMILDTARCDNPHQIQYLQIQSVQIGMAPDLVGWTGENDQNRYWLEPVIINRNGSQPGFYHRVNPGESWSVIAHSTVDDFHGFTVHDLQLLNPELVRPGEVLHPGDRIWIPFSLGG